MILFWTCKNLSKLNLKVFGIVKKPKLTSQMQEAEWTKFIFEPFSTIILLDEKPLCLFHQHGHVSSYLSCLSTLAYASLFCSWVKTTARYPFFVSDSIDNNVYFDRQIKILKISYIKWKKYFWRCCILRLFCLLDEIKQM